MKKLITRICKICGSSFEPTRHQMIYCSKNCNRKEAILLNKKARRDLRKIKYNKSTHSSDGDWLDYSDYC